MSMPPPPSGYGEAPASAVGGNYAEWPMRVLSALIDYVVPFIIAGIVYTISDVLGTVVYIAALVWAFYQAYQGGATGQSMGKQMVGTRVISEATGQPIGGGMGIARYLLHIVDALPCYIGYLWPLWDAKKQTFSDKIVKTVVVKV
jgi:uncharacterized RDD family membrane protein YckC